MVNKFAYFIFVLKFQHLRNQNKYPLSWSNNRFGNLLRHRWSVFVFKCSFSFT